MRSHGVAIPINPQLVVLQPTQLRLCHVAGTSIQIRGRKKEGKKGAENFYHHRTPRIAKANCMWRKKI